MARRWTWWIGLGVLPVVLLSLGTRGLLPGGALPLSGLTPVSRVLVRAFSIHAGEANRPLLEKVRGSGKGGEAGTLPEILLLDGKIRFEPMGPLERWGAKGPEVRIRPARFLGARVT